LPYLQFEKVWSDDHLHTTEIGKGKENGFLSPAEIASLEELYSAKTSAGEHYACF